VSPKKRKKTEKENRLMHFPVKKFEAGVWTEVQDEVANEEPLQITLDGVPVAVVMRSPGDDEDLVRGFLLTEGIVSDATWVKRVDLEQKQNHALVFLKDEVVVDYSKLQRNLYSASSCGICGKASMDAVFQVACQISAIFEINESVILSAPEKLRQAQLAFSSTGGIHAAGLFTNEGEAVVVREDVGRHNAVDKVIGWGSSKAVDLNRCFLQISGRVSFEVMQKALMVGIPAVSAISAPSSLAVNFARESNMALYGFVRGQRMNRYA
jgi:FdhD protein